MARLLKTIRFDSSDDNVFCQAAGEREWAISCAFQFCDLQFDEMDGKTRQAFSSGFLGLKSFGYSTFAFVASLGDDELSSVEMTLAKYLFEKFGAPSLGHAMAAARQEISYASQLCEDVPDTTVFAVSREFSLDGRINEAFRKIEPGADKVIHDKVWTLVEE